MVTEGLPIGDNDSGRESDGARVGCDEDRTGLWLWGAHDVATAGLVSTALVEAITLDDSDDVADLGDVEFMDASAVGVLVRGRELLTNRGRLLTVRSPPRGPRRVLALCGLAQMIEDAPSGVTRDGDGSTALETWVEVRATEGRAESPQPALRDKARDDPEASRP